MLIIRKRQAELLKTHRLKQFENKMVSHVNRFFPGQCIDLGEEKVREMIAYGIMRAKTYHILTELDICRYVDLMFSLGRDFDVDPGLDWAASMLMKINRFNSTERVDLLCAEAEKQLSEY